MKLRQDQISKLLHIIERTKGKEIKIEAGNLIIHLNEKGNMEVYEVSPVEIAPEELTKGTHKEDIISITAPSAGVFYRRPEPKAPPYVEVGSIVEPGDTLALIEVMKSFGPVVSEIKGEVVEILVNDSMPVEYGQTLFHIKRLE